MVRLPVDDHLPAIAQALATRRAVIVTAAPGAGKTTRVPPALAAAGRVLLLQPRRVAARAIARRIASEQGWTAGQEVGWQVRLERRFTDQTRLLVATEGILTARLIRDPLLADFHTLVIDEFHERSIHADLGLALAAEAWRARDDLRLVVMSATIDASRVSRYLDDCPVIDVPGREFPLTIEYRPGVSVEDAAADLAPRADGATLCFLPGAPEIRRAAAALAGRLPTAIPILPLHGRLDADAQDAAIRPGPVPRVILATNLAETTLTVPDVTCVIDTGLHKVARHDPARGLESLRLERVPRDAADQRAGRAGRVGPGRVCRLWDARDRLRPHREPDIARVDLASTLLDVIGWGGDPRRLAWFEAPPAEAVDAAFALLVRLGALDAAGRLTADGRRLRRLPVHPRLGRLLLSAHGAPRAARACAWLSEARASPRGPAATTASDVVSAIDEDLPPPVRRVADDLARSAARVVVTPAVRLDDDALRRAVLEAFPDRVARRRAAGDDRFVLATGTGARLVRESGVLNHAFVVAVEVTAPSVPGGEALIRIASGIDPAWLAPTSDAVRHELTADGAVRAVRVERYDDLILRELPARPDPEAAARLLASAWLDRARPEAVVQLERRAAFAGVALDLAVLVDRAARGARRLDEIDPAAMMAHEEKQTLDRLAPAALDLPSGRRARLDYRDEGRVVASVKLQELFGLAETPRLGPSRQPLTFELLAPNGRPVQVTTDLRSFWNAGYQEVRRELRARYPKHPWPDDPWSAPPTHRVKRSRS